MKSACTALFLGPWLLKEAFAKPGASAAAAFHATGGWGNGVPVVLTVGMLDAQLHRLSQTRATPDLWVVSRDDFEVLRGAI